jgi:hypothetical protein
MNALRTYKHFLTSKVNYVHLDYALVELVSVKRRAGIPCLQFTVNETQKQESVLVVKGVEQGVTTPAEWKYIDTCGGEGGISVFNWYLVAQER